MPAIIRRLRTEPIDDPPGAKPEQRADDQLADRVARRDHRARPAELAHHEVVVERQPVQREPDHREQRGKGGRDDERRRRVYVQLRSRHPEQTRGSRRHLERERAITRREPFARPEVGDCTRPRHPHRTRVRGDPPS